MQTRLGTIVVFPPLPRVGPGPQIDSDLISDNQNGTKPLSANALPEIDNDSRNEQ
jgi:hypothetical protein